MFRTLIVLAALALSGCASYGTAHHHHDDRAPVYADGSYYSPSASGYGDYYYAPEYRYDYYDDYGYGYGYGYPYGYGYGAQHFCSFRYRPCSYGSYWGTGFGLSLFFGRGWNHWDPWYPWPYYGGWHRDRDWDDDRDWNRDRDRDHRPRQPSPPYTGGDRNRVRPPASSTPWPMPRQGVTPPRTDTPYPIRDRNRDPRYRDERGALPQPQPRDRNYPPVPRDRNVIVLPRDPNAAPQPVYGVRPAPQQPPRDRNGGGWQVEPPEPRAPAPRDRNEDDRPAPPPPVQRERSGERRDDRNVRRDDQRRPALQ